MKLYVSENLKRLRKEKGFTQEQLATRLNVSFQAVSKWECGEIKYTTSHHFLLLYKIACKPRIYII